MRKRVGIIKRISALALIFLLSINSFAVSVVDNDGSAFITKSEFDALKSQFQAQIDTFNHGIDSKIDNAIASYLSGMNISSEQDVNSSLYTILTQNSNVGFYNMNGTNPHNYFTYDPVVTFNGLYFIECGYRAIYYRAQEVYTGYVVKQALNSTIGNSNNYILVYENIGGKKVYTKVINGLTYAYMLNRTLYFSGNDLYYGGYIQTMKFAKNNTITIKAPGTYSTDDPSVLVATTLGFAVAQRPVSGYTYTAIDAYVPSHANNARYNDPAQTWESKQVYTYQHVDKAPNNVLTNYRYDYKVNDLTRDVPLYDVSTSNYNILDEQNGLDEQSSYELTAITLKNTLVGSFGGGAMINAVGLGGNAGTSPTTINSTHDISINKLKITKNQKPNTIYNRYIYDYYGLFLPNNEIYLPLVSNRQTKKGTGTFTIKPNTTAGSLEIYENEIGTATTTRIKISGKKVSDSSSIGTDENSLSLSSGIDYSIDFNVLGNKNYMIRWTPSSNTIGPNKFNTSNLIKIKFD